MPKLSPVTIPEILDCSHSALQGLLTNIPKLYTQKDLKKRDGRIRTINVPHPELKIMQKRILMNILEKFALPRCVFGVKGHGSIIDNARAHVKAQYLLNLDLKDFFSSIHWAKIKKLFIEFGFNEEQANILTRLVTLNWSLPQGAPTSPYLANLAVNNLDYRFYNLSKANNLIYTRYFDDISISGNRRLESLVLTFLSIIQGEGYKNNPNKQKLYCPSESKEITGLILVNGSIDVKNFDDVSDYLHGLLGLKTDKIEQEKQSLYGKISFIASANPSLGRNLADIYKRIPWP